MASQVRSAHILAKEATASKAEEFIELVETVSRQLAAENGKVGTLKITGRLVEAAPVGEAIVVGKKRRKGFSGFSWRLRRPRRPLC